MNIQNIDDYESFKWHLDRYLNPTDHRSVKITKADKDFSKRPNFKDKKSPVKTRDIHKIEKKYSISISVFCYENKEKHPIYESKKYCKEKSFDLLLMGEEGKRHYVIYEVFNKFMYDYT